MQLTMFYTDFTNNFFIISKGYSYSKICNDYWVSYLHKKYTQITAHDLNLTGKV